MAVPLLSPIPPMMDHDAPPQTPPHLLPPSVSRELFSAHEKNADERHAAVMKALDEIKQGLAQHSIDDVRQFSSLTASVAVLKWALGIVGAGSLALFVWALRKFE